MFHRLVPAISLLSLLVGCGGGESTAPVGEGRGQDTLVIASISDIGNLVSPVQETSGDSDILSNIAMPLVRNDFDCSLKKKPGIATDWEWSEDGKILSMTLRDDITFEDGVKLTAHDIKFTYELVADPEVASPRISYIERMVDGKRPLVIDDTHIEWHFTEAYDRDTQVAHASAVDALPRHVLADADRATLRGHPLGKAPLSTGPWRLALWEPNTRIVLEQNPNFTGPEDDRAHLERVIFKIIPDYNTRLLELQNGDVDLMQAINVSDGDLLRKENPEIRLVRRGWRAMDYVGWNLERPLFSDKKVRQALAHAVDTEAMIAALLTSETGEAYARRAVGTITPALCGVHNDDISPFPYDPEKAKEMLAEAGWTDTDGDGILDKDGVKFSFMLTTNSGNKRRGDAAVHVQSDLSKIGIEMGIEKQESNTFYENLRQKDFDAALGGWSAGLFIDPTTIWHSDIECGEGAAPDCEARKYEFNFVSYRNPVADELMERGLRTPIPEESAPIWKEMQGVIYDDQPYLFLWWMDEIVGINERFVDTKIDLLSGIHDLHEWRVPDDKVKYRTR